MSSTINKTSQVTPGLSDLIAIWDASNSTTRNTSLSLLMDLFQENMNLGKPTTQYSAPSATGFSVDVLDTGADVHLLLTPVGAYAAGTIVLPVSVADKQTVLVSCTQDVTALTISSTKSVNGAPTALTANDFFTLKYDLTLDSWYRVG